MFLIIFTSTRAKLWNCWGVAKVGKLLIFSIVYIVIPFGLNPRAWNQYQRLVDRSIDVVSEPIQPWKALTSYKFLLYAILGYWLSFLTGMAVLFRKKI
jgi:hypothetical protein